MTEDNFPSTIQTEEENEEDVELYSMVSQPRRAPSPGEEAEPIVGPDGEEYPYHKIEFIHDVPLQLSAEIGQSTLAVREILALSVGKVVEFTKVVGEPMDITVSGRLMARGEIVVVNERYGVRISEVTRPDETGSSSFTD
ncbi:MAG: flagellar motor switch protein FliN [bacterium]